MRILQINDHCSYAGGIEKYISEVENLLKNKGHSSHLMCFRGKSKKNIVPDTTSISIHLTKHLDDNSRAKLERSIAQYRPDVAFIHGVSNPSIIEWVAHNLPTLAYVHSHYLACPGYARYLRKSGISCQHKAGAICMINAQKERCCYGRNPRIHWDKLRWVRRLIRVYKNLTILVGSGYMAEVLRLNGIPERSISTLPPIVFTSETPTYRPPPDNETILFVGRLIPEKGFDTLIEALTMIGRDWNLIVAGGVENIGHYQELAVNLGMADRIQFYGLVSESEIERLYQKCSFVVIPSIWPEPYGRVGPEAFRHGRPAIAFDVGGIPAWLDDGVNGYLAAAGDAAKLGIHINHLLNNPEEQVRLGIAAYKKAKSAWKADVHAARLLETMTLASRIFSHQSRIDH